MFLKLPSNVEITDRSVAQLPCIIRVSIGFKQMTSKHGETRRFTQAHLGL